jgi:hypothetical protein
LQTISLPKAEILGPAAFVSCTALHTVDFPKATEVWESCLFFCSSLQTVNLPEAIQIRPDAFGSSGVKTVNLPKAEQFGLWAFRECYDLETLVLGANPPELNIVGLMTLPLGPMFFNTDSGSGGTITIKVPNPAAYSAWPQGIDTAFYGDNSKAVVITTY